MVVTINVPTFIIEAVTCPNVTLLDDPNAAPPPLLN
jgi:hypothetical protein